MRLVVLAKSSAGRVDATFALLAGHDQGNDQPEGADSHEDDSGCVEIDTADAILDGEGHHGADSDQDE